MIEEHDGLVIRCPQLGGEVPFKYCRTLQENLPCHNIVICWEFRIEIGKFLSKNYSPNQIQKVFTPPKKTRLERIVELIEEAKRLKDPSQEN